MEKNVAYALRHSNKFYTLNLNALHDLIDNTNIDVSYKELLVLLYLLSKLTYNYNTISVDDDDREYLKKKFEIANSSLNHFFTKMIKLDIFRKIEKNFYSVNKKYVCFGQVREGTDKFTKVHAFSLYEHLKVNKDIKVSSTEIKLLVYILKDIEFSDPCKPFGGNTITLTKDDKVELAKKFDISERTFKGFMKTMKDLDLLIKMNNSTFKVNPNYINCGGEFLFTPADDAAPTEKHIDAKSIDEADIDSEIPDPFTEEEKAQGLEKGKQRLRELRASGRSIAGFFKGYLDDNTVKEDDKNEKR